MNGIAVLAAREVAVASGFGFGLGFLPSIPPSAVEGFAAGTLLSGCCFLLVAMPWRRGRKAQPAGARAGPAASVRPGSVARHPALTADVQAPSPPSVAAVLAALPMMTSLSRQEPVLPGHIAGQKAETVSADSPQLGALSQARHAGKHRQPASSRERAPAGRPAGKHAAPSSRRSGRTGELAGRRQLAGA